jgi:hypothetical protein
MDSTRLDSVQWFRWYAHLYKFARHAGHEESHAHDRADGFVRTVRNICAGACMTADELADEEKRFAADAAGVEEELEREAKATRREHERETLRKRREHFEYWNELQQEQMEESV